jgi:Arabinose-binding domain of AraC transcription regulator, N-term
MDRRRGAMAQEDIMKRTFTGVFIGITFALGHQVASLAADENVVARPEPRSDTGFSVMLGLDQWLVLGGANVAAQYKTRHFVIEASHGQALQLNRLTMERDGCDRKRLLEQAGIGADVDPAAPDLRVSLAQYLSLWEAALAAAGRPGLPLRVATALGHESFGVARGSVPAADVAGGGLRAREHGRRGARFRTRTAGHHGE